MTDRPDTLEHLATIEAFRAAPGSPAWRPEQVEAPPIADPLPSPPVPIGQRIRVSAVAQAAHLEPAELAEVLLVRADRLLRRSHPSRERAATREAQALTGARVLLVGYVNGRGGMALNASEVARLLATEDALAELLGEAQTDPRLQPLLDLFTKARTVL